MPESNIQHKPQARQMNFTQDSIEALHRRIFSGQMVFPEARALSRGTKADAAVTENTGRPFWCQKKVAKRKKMTTVTKWICMAHLSYCW